MSYDAIADVIKSHFQTEWAVAQPDVEWFGPNSGPAPDFAEPWVALDIIMGDSLQINVAPPQWRRSGNVVISIFVPVNSGDDLLNAITDTGQAIFENQPLVDALGNQVTFYGTEVIPVETTERFSQYNVVHDFNYEDLN